MQDHAIRSPVPLEMVQYKYQIKGGILLMMTQNSDKKREVVPCLLA